MLTWIRRIIRPPVFENDEEALPASLLHKILIFFAATSFIVPLLLNFIAILNPNDDIPFELTTVVMGLVVPAFALGLLELLHRGQIRLASILMTGLLFLLTTSTIITFRGTRDTASSMYILVIALAGLLLGGQAAIIFMGLSLLATLGIFWAEVTGLLDLTVSETPEIIEWIIFAVVVVLIGILLRFAFETLTTAFRRARKANDELEVMQSSLSERVAARTRDLELAGEIGRYLSRVQESEGILLEAVELIRSRFDLYYTQIYLVDPTRNNLLLRAGTGVVGRQLRELGHRLPINGSSINGTAVINKQPVVVSDTTTSAIFRKNPLLPETRSEMAVPLIVSESVVGVLNLQSVIPNSLTEENLTAFEALAGQLAVALDNARLFSEASEAQGAVESLAQRLTRDSWESYLNAIDREESIAFTYDTTNTEFIDTPIDSQNRATFSVPIHLGGEDLGKIEILGNEWDSWREEDKELAAAVGQRVAQQIENLRLLSETERYRNEAEEATRRLVREGWESYLGGQEMEGDGFLYDQKQVTPLPANGHNGRTEAGLVQPLTVRGEEIGRFEIDGISSDDEEASNLIGAVADRLSAHIENLRLANQTENALRSTERRAEELAVVNRIAQVISQAMEIEQMLNIILEEITKILPVDAFIVGLYDDEADLMQFPLIYDDGERYQSGYDRPSPQSTVYQVLKSHEPQLVLRTPEEVDERTKNTPSTMVGNEAKVSASLMYMPLFLGRRSTGVVSIQSYEFDAYGPDDLTLLGSIASHVAVALENARLFEETQNALSQTEKQAERMAVINQIAQAVSGKTEQDELLQTVYEQVQRIMLVDAFSVTMYDPDTEYIHYLMVMDEGQRFEEAPTPLGSGSVSLVIQSGKPILLNRSAAELEELERKRGVVLIGNVQRFSASMIYVPLQIGSETIGGLSVQSYELNAYDQPEVDLLVGIANHVAVALENSRLFEATQSTLAETELLYKIGTHINQAATMDDLVNVIGIPGIANGADSAGLFRFELGEDGRADWMEMAANWVGEGDPVLPIGTRLHLRQIPLAAAELYTPNEPLLIGNIVEDERVDDEARMLLQGLNTKAVAIIPMQQLNVWIGTLIIRWKEIYNFGIQEQRLYNSLARQMSTALSNQLLLTETQDRATQLEKIALIETALSQAQDEVGILNALGLVLDESQAASIHYAVEEDAPATAFTVAHWEEGRIQTEDEMLYRPFEISLHAGMDLAVEQPDRISTITNIQTDERVGKLAAKEAKRMGFQSVAVVPLRSAGRWQGFISIKWSKRHEFSGAEIAVWERLRESLAAIIASRRAYLAQQEALSETAVLYETGAQLSIARSYDSVLSVLRNNTVLGQNISNVGIMLFEHDWQADDKPAYADVLTFWSDLAPDQAKSRFHFSHYPSSDKILDGKRQALVFNDVPNSTELDDNLKEMLIRGFNTDTFVLFPMIVRGNWIGYVNAMYPEPMTLSEKDIRRTEAIIQQAGVAVQGLRNLEQAEQQALESRNRSNELAILNEMGRSLTALVDMDTILENVYRYTARLMDATNFYISFFDAKRNEIAFALDIRGEEVMRNAGTRKAGAGLTEHIIYSKTPLLIPDNVDDKLDELGIEKIGPISASWLGVPLMVGSQVIGVIGVQHWDKPRTYNEQHLRLLTSVAGQAAIAIENARLFEQIQARARRERILREVTAKVRSGADADTVMRTAVSEIGRALGRRTFVYLNETEPQRTNGDKEDVYGD